MQIGKKYKFMMDKSEPSTSIEFKEHDQHQEKKMLAIIDNCKSQEIKQYKNALAKAEKIIYTYQLENSQLIQQNAQLKKKTQQYELKLRETMKHLIYKQEQISRQLQMRNQIADLNKKLLTYQKTIEALEDKLLILNVGINKQAFLYKCEDRISTQISTSFKQQKIQQKYLDKFDKNHTLHGQMASTPKRTISRTKTMLSRNPVQKLMDFRKKAGEIRKHRIETEGCSYYDMITPRSSNLI